MEFLRLHFPGVHHALREALDSLSTFASYFLGDTVPSAEERGGNLSRTDGGRGEELGEMTAEGNQQAEESKEALEEEVISSRDLADTFSSRGSESREAWEKGKEKKGREIQESKAEGIWETGKEVRVCLNEEMTRVCRTWDSSNKNSKEAKGEIRGNYKVEVQGAGSMMGIEPKQGQKIDAVEARECKKKGILVEGYLETEGFASEEKGGKKPKAQDKKNQKPSKEKVNAGKTENYWKQEETELVGEKKEEVKEIKPGDLEERALIAFGVESENGIIWEKEKDRQTPEIEGNVKNWQEAREGEKAQRMKKGEPGNSQKIEIETRGCKTKKTPDRALGGGFGKDGKVETSEKQELEKHEVKGTWEVERSEITCAKKEREKEVAWEVQGIKPVDIDIKKLQGVQEPGEKTERKDSVKPEVWITSVMEKAEAREAVKSKTAETSPKKEGEEAWKAEDMEISREWNMEVIQRGWDTEEALGKDLKKKDKERGTEENTFPEQVQTQKIGREEEVVAFWVMEKKETVKVIESRMEVEKSWGLEGEAGESCENQSEQNVGQDIQETTIWKGTLDNVSKSKEIGSVKAKEVMGIWERKPGRPQGIETERIEDSEETWVTRPEKEVEGAKLMREAEVGKRQELETNDKVSYGTEEVKEDQNPEEIGENWNMEAETGRAQETENKSKEVQDLKEEEAKGREEEPFRIPESRTLEGCEMEAYSAQNIENTENGNVQDVKKQDLVVVEGWKITREEVESGQVTEIEDRGGCEGKEEVFTPWTREDKGNWNTKGNQEFKQEEVPKAEVKTGWGTKETGTTEPEMEEKKVRGDWEKELKGGQEAQVDKGHKMEESEVRKLQEREAMEAKGYWEAEGEVIRNQEMKEVEGSQEREDERSRTLDLESGRTWEREEKESEGDQETDSADAEGSWMVGKEEAEGDCEKEQAAFYQAAERQVVTTNKEVELGIEEELKEGQVKSEEKPEKGQENRETGKGIEGDQGVNSLEEETGCEEDTQAEAKVGGSHAVEGESSMDNQYMEKVEPNEGRRLEAEKMEVSDNIEEAGQGDGKREELEPAVYSDPKKAAGWGDEDKDSEASGVWESSEKTGRVWDLEKADPGQGRRREEAADTGSGALEALENRETEATAPTNSIALRLSPASNPADETQSSWSEAPIPGPCLDLSIPRSRVLLSRNASQRRSRPSFRRAPAPKNGDNDDDDESLSFLPNEEEAPASKLRLLQPEETAVPRPPKPEETGVTARKRPLGHGFGFAHPSMMQELQARMGRPKPQ
ncbi:apolipoprotein B receptor [Petaurus breviceps papuanus]|uniref:apolipoprotein B receptor n=1 Tax=Petaurus breviceps papuanus TaxID=3040969 RepID=UPI0036D7E87C